MIIEDYFESSSGGFAMTSEAILSHLYKAGVRPIEKFDIPFPSDVLNGDRYYFCKPIAIKVSGGVLPMLNKVMRVKLSLYSPTDISKESGVTRASVSNWKKGVDLGIKSLESIIDAYGYSLNAEVSV